MLTLLLVAAPGALAATLTVGPSGRDYSSIQAAVDAASDGDVIEVDAGTYNESVSVADDLTITGLEGSSATIISSDGTALTLTSADVTLSGFTLAPTGGRGASVRGGTVVLSDLIVSGGDSSDENGGGLYVLESALTLDGCTLLGGDAGAGNGGNLYLSESTAVIRDCAIGEGIAEKGGGIYAYGSELEISDSSLEDNQALSGGEKPRGGGIRGEDSTFALSGVSFANNIVTGGYGGHISAYGGGVTVTDSSFKAGTSIGSYGGAIVAYDADLSVSDSSFESNRAEYLSGASDEVPNGGAIVLVEDAEPTEMLVEGCTFSDNGAEGTGGAMRLYGGTATISGTSFDANSATRGGAIYATLSTGLSIDSAGFTGNEGGTGGAIYWRPDEATGTLDLRYCELSGNSADDYGGALYAYGGGALELGYSSFSNNSAQVGGGAMLWSVPSVQGRMNTFCANTVSTGDADGAGLLVYEAGDTLNTWTNNLFVENVASSYGGGLMMVGAGEAVVRNNHFVGNGAERGGGAYFYGLDASFTNNLVAFNDEGDGVYASTFDSFTLKYNDFYDNDSDPVSGVLDPDDMDASNLDEDPLLTAWTDDGDCGDDQLWPSDGSPLVDAGDPDLSDADGSASDIGAYGGEEADWEGLVDGDGDGAAAALDCDDGDDTIYPGADETPYDDIDQDCDGLDLTDVDNDGVDGEAAGGADCDDADAAIYPGATETWYDGVDSDCDGADDDDQDGDGHGAEASGGDDCDDLDADIHPGATDTEGDGVDSDCDGRDSEQVPESDDTGPTVGDDTGLTGETGGGGGKDGGCACGSASRPGGAGLGLVLAIATASRARRRRDPEAKRIPGA